VKPTVLIFGSIEESEKIGRALTDAGMAVTRAVPHDEVQEVAVAPKTASTPLSTNIVPISECISCTGSSGDFKVRVVRDGVTESLSAHFVVIARHVLKEPGYALYGLTPMEQVIPLSELERPLGLQQNLSPEVAELNRTAFLVGIHRESDPQETRRAMSCALRLQKTGKHQTYLFTGNLKVAADGSESLYREAQGAGTVFVKWEHEPPQIRQTDGGDLFISFTDAVTRDRCRLAPDLIVIDERPYPSPFTRQVSQALRLHNGPDGAGPSDNVHRTPVLTNRRGILAVGLSGNEEKEIGALKLTLAHAARDLEADATAAAVIDTGLCVRCLTCLRVCPHLAVELSVTAPAIHPRACEGCGICTAECPRGAIRMATPITGIPALSPEDIAPAAEPASFTPVMIAFCCTRSAVKAGDVAAHLGLPLPAGLRTVSVPCTGGISAAHLYEAFRRGADGVLVVTCHPGNCFSEYGERHLARRVEEISSGLRRMGLPSERLAVASLAANMSGGFAETVDEFEEKIRALGPSPVARTRSPLVGND